MHERCCRAPLVHRATQLASPHNALDSSSGLDAHAPFPRQSHGFGLAGGGALIHAAQEQGRGASRAAYAYRRGRGL